MKVEGMDRRCRPGVSELSQRNKELKPECVIVRGEVSVSQKTNEQRTRIKRAIEENDLCYNCETGFHYMKQ